MTETRRIQSYYVMGLMLSDVNVCNQLLRWKAIMDFWVVVCCSRRYFVLDFCLVLLKDSVGVKGMLDYLVRVIGVVTG